MKLTTNAFEDGQAIGEKYSFCRIAEGSDPVTFAENLNPDLAWTEVPENTQSFVLIFHDETVPTKPDDVNQADREVPSDLPRADFFHWLLADIPADTRELKSGAFSSGVTGGGKSKDSSIGRVGLNDYTGWFAGGGEMEGKYFGYDGPCPPWNDSLIHRYHFTIYALDVPNCELSEEFNGGELRASIEGHILDSASLSCTYTLNPRLK